MLCVHLVEPQKIFDPPISDSTFSTESSAILTWQFPGGTVDYFMIKYVLTQDSEGFASSNAIIRNVNGSQTSAIIGNLSSGAIYKFHIAVVNSHGTSKFSECGVFQTLNLGKSECPLFLMKCVWCMSLPSAANTTSKSTILIAFASVLSIVLAMSLVIFTTVIIVVCVRSKKQVSKDSDVYYETINIGHHSKQPSVIETETNVAYGHTKST